MTKGAALAICLTVFLGFAVSAAGSKVSAAASSATQAKHTETYEEEVFPSKHRVQHRLKTRGAHAAHHRKSISTPVVTAAAPPAVVALSAPSSVESETESPVLPDVPKPANTGADGYPHLPPVSGMLASASATLKNINSQASVLEERIVRVQRENEAKMTRQKAVFEQKLKTQEEGNRKEENMNTKLAQEIAVLKDGNKVLRSHAKELQAGNAQMREELHVLQAKLTTAREFVSQSLINTDDSKAKELGVLEVKKATTVVGHGRHRKHGHHEVHDGKVEDLDDDQDDDDDDDAGKDKDDDVEEAASFLAVKVKRSTRTGVAAKVKADSSSDEDSPDDVDDDASDSKSEKDEDEAGAAAAQARVPEPAHAAGVDKPLDIVRVLSQGVESLATEERQSEAQLKAMFLKGFEAGTRRHAALISQQKALNSTKRSLDDLQAGLKEAESHLLSTKSKLQQRVHAAGLFLQKLGHLALAPVAEVPQLIKSFPSEVMTKTKKAEPSTVAIADIQK